jgi:hypothetical protein
MLDTLKVMTSKGEKNGSTMDKAPCSVISKVLAYVVEPST